MSLPLKAEQYQNCSECDGECIGSTVCGPDGYAVCCACKRPGCLLTIEEYNNLSEKCRLEQEEAVRILREVERELFRREA